MGYKRRPRRPPPSPCARSCYDDYDQGLVESRSYPGIPRGLFEPGGVERATNLLAEGLGTERVAHELGYSHASSFVRAFRAATGRNPSEIAIEHGHAPARLRERGTRVLRSRDPWAAI